MSDDTKMAQAPPVEGENENRYSIAAMDQLDDDEPTTTQPQPPPATATASAVPEIESYGTAVGVIEPPPDLKVIIDKTADFVRRVGTQFEGEILQRNKGKKQFQFLENPASPYHPYYKQRVRYGPEGPPVSAADAASGALARAAEAEAKQKEAEEEKAAAAAVLEKPKVLTLQEKLRAYIDSTHKVNKEKLQQEESKLKEKEAAHATANAGHSNGTTVAPATTFSFRLKHPEQYSAVDIDIIKLTALYLARCGLEFLHGLQRRESRNPYFDFLKPQHFLFIFFQHLVDSYKKIILNKREMQDELEMQLKKQTPQEYYEQLLVDAVLKKKAEQAAAKKKDEEDSERLSSITIDWKDFVVVETITFLDGEDEFLPAPRETVEEMAAMLSAQTLEEAPAATTTTEDMDMDVDMDTEETKPSSAPAAASPPAAAKEDEVSQLIRSAVVIPPEEQLEIRANDDDTSTTKSRAAVFQKCIVCGDEIAIDDLAEHMRIELLDPRWKEQKQALLDRQRESSLTADSVVGVNLARLAKRTAQLQGEDPTAGQRNEMKARKQALADAILLYGPNSLQAQEAAKRAGEILPPPPTPQSKAPAPTPAAPVLGPSGFPSAQSHQQQPTYPPPSNPHMPTRPPPPPPGTVAPGPPGLPTPSQQPRPPMPIPPPHTALAPPGLTAAPLPPPSYPVPSMMPPGLAYPPGTYQPSPPMAYPGAPGLLPTPSPPQPAYPPYIPPPPPSTAFIPPPPSTLVAPPPPPMAGGLAGQVHAAPTIAAEDEPSAKKQRTTEPTASSTTTGPVKGKLIPEGEFIASQSNTQVILHFIIPSDPSVPFNFSGQQIHLNLPLTATIQQVKDGLSPSLNSMPPNKMKLQFAPQSGGGHLNKDELTLAYYNSPPEATIMVGVKERGGKKK